MPLVTTIDMLNKARTEGYAVGAFNVNNMEMTQAVIEAGVEEKAPIILQFSIGAIRYAGLSVIVGMVKAAVSDVEIPIALHFDHGANYEQTVACIENGFTSVMYDGSSLSIEENIYETKRICEFAHARNIPVEAELGRVPHEGATHEEINALLTNPEQAKYFIQQTKSDSLAVAIGSVHAQYNQKTGLDFDRLKKIKYEIPDIPLVLHGSSGVMSDCIKEAIEYGINKVNVGTCLTQSFTGAMINYVNKHQDETDPRKHFRPARKALKETVREKIRLFGSNNTIRVTNSQPKFQWF